MKSSEPAGTLKLVALIALATAVSLFGLATDAGAVIYNQGKTALAPTSIPQFVTPLVIPPAMPRTGKLTVKGGPPAAPGMKKEKSKNIDYYEIAVRQFQQQILPGGAYGFPTTTVWSYGNAADPDPGIAPNPGVSSFNFPAFTIESKYQTPVRIKWVNELVAVDPNTGYPYAEGDVKRTFLPHLLPVDQTLHWANPVGNCLDNTTRTDCRGTSQDSYTGPVPMISHLHGAETYEWADGYPEAWYLPVASNTPGYIQFDRGSFYDTFKTGAEAFDAQNPITWNPGSATFQYPNDMRATTLWYHDHSLGMTRLNVYAGPAGFYLLRGGPDDMVVDNTTGLPAVLPGPAPALGDLPGTKYYEIPVVIQDRSFNTDGSLAYPDNRAFFEGLNPPSYDEPILDVPYIPEVTPTGQSDVAPIWNPEFFGNTIVVNGNTWPFLNVEARRYRIRFLNGCQSRFLIVKADNNMPFWQIGSEGGFLPASVMLNELLIGPAERADVIMDFTGMEGQTITLLNLGPDEPFGGGVRGVDYFPADPDTTGKVMQFVIGAVDPLNPDTTTPVGNLALPVITPLDPALAANTRRISLNEKESESIFVAEDGLGNVYYDPTSITPFGPTEALLGTMTQDGYSVPLGWAAPTTENPGTGDMEVWEIHNFTADAHPIHIHLVQFQVVNREGLLLDLDGEPEQPAFLTGVIRGPESWETGFKDTVIAYPGEVTRVVAQFTYPGLYVWHCHILEHEDNEMMRPYCVGNSPACQQHNGAI